MMMNKILLSLWKQLEKLIKHIHSFSLPLPSFFVNSQRKTQAIELKDYIVVLFLKCFQIMSVFLKRLFICLFYKFGTRRLLSPEDLGFLFCWINRKRHVFAFF